MLAPAQGVTSLPRELLSGQERRGKRLLFGFSILVLCAHAYGAIPGKSQQLLTGSPVLVFRSQTSGDGTFISPDLY
ncbi:hypothetical protein V8B97DRAFT_1951440 [Scleroderma yunnanense]